jgi:hypothetical protein
LLEFPWSLANLLQCTRSVGHLHDLATLEWNNPKEYKTLERSRLGCLLSQPV